MYCVLLPQFIQLAQSLPMMQCICLVLHSTLIIAILRCHFVAVAAVGLCYTWQLSVYLGLQGMAGLEVTVPHPYTLYLIMVIHITKIGLWCTAAWSHKLMPFFMLHAQIFLFYLCLWIFPQAAITGTDVTHNVTWRKRQQCLRPLWQIWARRYRVSYSKQRIMINDEVGTIPAPYACEEVEDWGSVAA